MFYDYVDGGSWSESTYRANEVDFQKLQFRQGVAVNIEHRSTSSNMLGEAGTMPTVIAPTGLTGMQHADCEIHAANAAMNFGIQFTLSTMSICSIEDVAQATRGHPFWFQLYVVRDRGFVKSLIDRARAANCSALMVTLDLQVPGQRHNDKKNGLSTPPQLTLRSITEMMSRPRWCTGMMSTHRRQFGNIVGHVSGVKDIQSLSEWSKKQFDPTLSWDDIAWIKAHWKGKIILKGILDPQDARIASEIGVDAIVVSNHGGPQLDGAPSTVSVLPSIVDAVGEQLEVHMDGRIRSGQDVLKALALGAKGTYIGRAMLYGLGAMGAHGVRSALQLELDLSMAFFGKTSIAQIDRSIFHAGT